MRSVGLRNYFVLKIPIWPYLSILNKINLSTSKLRKQEIPQEAEPLIIVKILCFMVLIRKKNCIEQDTDNYQSNAYNTFEELGNIEYCHKTSFSNTKSFQTIIYM